MIPARLSSHRVVLVTLVGHRFRVLCKCSHEAWGDVEHAADLRMALHFDAQIRETAA